MVSAGTGISRVSVEGALLILGNSACSSLGGWGTRALQESVLNAPLPEKSQLVRNRSLKAHLSRGDLRDWSNGRIN